MNRVLIVEGADGSGKSTLAETLRKDHGFKVIHTDKPKPNEPDLFNTYLMDLWLALHDDQPVVFDRLYLGEQIYGPIMRGKSLLSDLHVRLLDRVVRAYDIKHVLCIPPRPTAMANWMAKKEDYVDHVDKWDEVFMAYDRWSDHLLTYDYTHPGGWYDDDGGCSSSFSSLFMPSPTLPEGVVGSPIAKALLVGEQVNARVQELDLPFMDGSGSSAYLDEALQLVGFREEELAFCNAKDRDGTANSFSPWLSRFQIAPKVVALGGVASEILVSQKIAHCKVPHPQYWKRFNHSKLQEYANMLKEASC